MKRPLWLAIPLLLLLLLLPSAAMAKGMTYDEAAAKVFASGFPEMIQEGLIRSALGKVRAR